MNTHAIRIAKNHMYETWHSDTRSYLIWLAKYYEDKNKLMTGPGEQTDTISWVEVPEATRIPDPVFDLSQIEIEELMDELWRLGIRPSPRLVTEGEMPALRDQIQYLKELVETLMNAFIGRKSFND